MTQNAAVAWIVAQPGRLSDGWRALLLALPEITGVRRVDSTPSAWGALEAPGPDLVLLDTEAWGERAWALLDQIRANAPHCRCIALICSAHQQSIALAAGADAVLIRGFSAAELSATVKRLLAR